MTQRSERRRAELAVIEAARVVDVNHDEYGQADLSELAALGRAIKTLDDLDLAEPTQTRTSKMAGVNSNLAAAYMHGAKVSTQAGWILRRLSNCLAGFGYTTDELVLSSQRPHQSISARVNELRDAGWIVDSGTNRKTRSGQQAAVWTLTPEARDALHRNRYQP